MPTGAALDAPGLVHRAELGLATATDEAGVIGAGPAAAATAAALMAAGTPQLVLNVCLAADGPTTALFAAGGWAYTVTLHAGSDAGRNAGGNRSSEGLARSWSISIAAATWATAPPPGRCAGEGAEGSGAACSWFEWRASVPLPPAEPGERGGEWASVVSPCAQDASLGLRFDGGLAPTAVPPTAVPPTAVHLGLGTLRVGVFARCHAHPALPGEASCEATPAGLRRAANALRSKTRAIAAPPAAPLAAGGSSAAPSVEFCAWLRSGGNSLSGSPSAIYGFNGGGFQGGFEGDGGWPSLEGVEVCGFAQVITAGCDAGAPNTPSASADHVLAALLDRMGVCRGGRHGVAGLTAASAGAAGVALGAAGAMLATAAVVLRVGARDLALVRVSAGGADGAGAEASPASVAPSSPGLQAWELAVHCTDRGLLAAISAALAPALASAPHTSPASLAASDAALRASLRRRLDGLRAALRQEAADQAAAEAVAHGPAALAARALAARSLAQSGGGGASGGDGGGDGGASGGPGGEAAAVALAERLLGAFRALRVATGSQAHLTLN